MAKTYSEKLRDPRWQKRRLEILSRDNWCCRGCGDTEKTLNVHHLSYRRGEEPWDTPSVRLLTLCDRCHEAEGSYRRHHEVRLLDALKRLGLLASDIALLASHLSETDLKDTRPSAFALAIANLLLGEKGECLDRFLAWAAAESLELHERVMRELAAQEAAGEHVEEEE